MVTADFAVSEMKKAQSFDWAFQFIVSRPEYGLHLSPT